MDDNIWDDGNDGNDDVATGPTGPGLGRRMLGALGNVRIARRDAGSGGGRAFTRDSSVDSEKIERLLQQSQFSTPQGRMRYHANQFLGGVDKAVQNAGTGAKQAESVYKSPVLGYGFRLQSPLQREGDEKGSEEKKEAPVQAAATHEDPGSAIQTSATAAKSTGEVIAGPSHPEDLGFGVNDERSEFKDPFQPKLSY